jgi:sensor domain CHASE-containing protein/two-component sensor histidine kinase
MDIGKKVLIITLFIFAILTAAFTFTHNMQLSNFLELEQQDTLDNVERVQNAIATEQGYLDYVVQDWACWDETYQFVEDTNEQYININLQNQTLAGINVNVVLFVNNSGEVVYVKSVDTLTSEERPVPEELLTMIENGSLLTKGEDDSISGFVLLEEDPMFIACHPILTTKYEGPSKGTLIFGRYFDGALLDSFKEVTRSSLLMYRADEELPSDFQAINKNALKGQVSEIQNIVVKPLSEEKIAGYFWLRDIQNQPALIVRADFPRDLYSHGEKILNYMYFFLLLTGLMTGIGVKFFLDRLFISRLTEIDSFITKIGSEKDLSRRLPLQDNDELYRLSREINRMLNEIYLTEQELKAQEREKKVLLDSLNELVVFVSPELRIIWANKAALKHMQVNLEKAVGIFLKAAPDISGPLAEYPQLEQVFLTGEKKSGEFISKDGRIWIVQAIPVVDDQENIIGILETCRDITESKKADQLRKKEINHRIKNNLQIVSSLLDLQAEKFSDKKVIEAFKESENRIVSISLIHKELYESGDLDYLDFSSYIRKLVADLLRSYNTENSGIRVHLEIDRIFLGVDTAVSLGIVINELFTNSLKYAFPPGKGGDINIALFIEGAGGLEKSQPTSGSGSRSGYGSYENLTLIFSDNGKGFPENVDFRNVESLGLQLVNALVDQIDGSLDLERGSGTKFTIKFRDMVQEDDLKNEQA